MANYVIYTRPDKTEIKLKIDSERTVELEERFGDSIQKKLAETEKLSVSSEFIAAAIPDLEYAERKKTALAIYDEMVEAGKTYRDYLEMIHRVLAAAGFLDGGAVERQIKTQEASEELDKLAYQVRMDQIDKKMAELRTEMNVPAADTTATQTS